MESPKIESISVSWQNEEWRYCSTQFQGFTEFAQFLLDNGFYSKITVEQQFIKKEEPLAFQEP